MREKMIEKYKDCSYGELIRVRQELLDDLTEYEIYKNKGSHCDFDFIDVPDTTEGYQQKMRKLADLCTYMCEIYTEDTIVVDETNADSILSFAEGVFWGNEGYEVEENEAVKALGMLNRLAEKENADAANMIGALYYEGCYVEQDYDCAANWYMRAAKLGSSLAMCNAGYCFYYGNGVENDYEKAYGYFSKAATLGEWDAINKMGDMYLYGHYVAEDKKTAFDIYKRGYEIIPKEVLIDAYPANLVRLGDAFLHGYGCEENLSVAEKLLNEAKEIFELQVGYGRIYAESGLRRTDKLLEEVEAVRQA